MLLSCCKSMHLRVLLGLVCMFVIPSPSIALSSSTVNRLGQGNSSLDNFVRRQGVDSSLLKYANLALTQLQPRAGVIFNVSLPPSLSGIQAQAIILRSGSLKNEGLTFNEFSIPSGASINSSNNSSLLLIHRKVLNFTLYTLPDQYEFGGFVVGIITYPFSDSNTTVDPSLPELDIFFSNRSITINLPVYRSSQSNDSAHLCAAFGINGSVAVSNLSNTSVPNLCSSSSLGDFALILPSSQTVRSSNPSPSPAPLPSSNLPAASSNRSKPVNWKLIVGSIFLALGGLAFIAAVLLVCIAVMNSVRFASIGRSPKNDEALETSLIGTRRAPSAAGVRTRPTLEIDMARFRD